MLSLIADMGVVDVLEKIPGHLSEVLQLWARVHFGMVVGQLEECLSGLVKNVLFYDEVLATSLHGILSEGTFGELLCDITELDLDDSVSRRVAQEVAAFVDVGETLEQHGVDEKPLKQFLDGAPGVFQGLPDGLHQEVHCSGEATRQLGEGAEQHWRAGPDRRGHRGAVQVLGGTTFS